MISPLFAAIGLRMSHCHFQVFGGKGELVWVRITGGMGALCDITQGLTLKNLCRCFCRCAPWSAAPGRPRPPADRKWPWLRPGWTSCWKASSPAADTCTRPCWPVGWCWSSRRPWRWRWWRSRAAQWGWDTPTWRAAWSPPACTDASITWTVSDPGRKFIYFFP